MTSPTPIPPPAVPDAAPDAPPTTPGAFRNPHSLGNKVGRLLWRWVWLLLFRPTPPRLMGRWRRFLLRMFGAKIGDAYIHNSVEVWAPWLLELGDDVAIDKGTNLYNAYGITVGPRTVISQGVFLCTASHDYTKRDFPLIGGKITIGSDCWIAAEAFVAPGIDIASGAVIGARAVVIRDVEPWTVAAGNPAKALKKRVIVG